MLKINKTLYYLHNIDTCIFQYVTQNSTFTRQNTSYFAILELIPMYTLVMYRKDMYV